MPKLLGFIRPYILQPFSWEKKNYFFRKSFFLSFADSLLLLLQAKGLDKAGGYALLPDFYCPDTLKFISRYFKVVFYQVGEDFSVDLNSYFGQLERYQPALIINYCFTGDFLAADNRQKALALAPQALMIEDCAHRILLPADVNFVSPRQYFIDSIRKYSPVLGSHLIGQEKFLTAPKGLRRFNLYKLRCHFWQLTKGWLNFWAGVFRSPKLYHWAEELFLRQDEIIGWPLQPTLGSAWSFWLYNFLNLTALKKHFSLISRLYQKHFSQFNHPQVRTLPDHLLQEAELCYYPLFVSESLQEPLVRHLCRHNIFAERLWEADAKAFPETKSAFYNSFLIFPISWLMKEKDIVFISQKIKEFLTQSQSSNADKSLPTR